MHARRSLLLSRWQAGHCRAAQGAHSWCRRTGRCAGREPRSAMFTLGAARSCIAGRKPRRGVFAIGAVRSCIAGRQPRSLEAASPLTPAPSRAARFVEACTRALGGKERMLLLFCFLADGGILRGHLWLASRRVGSALAALCPSPAASLPYATAWASSARARSVCCRCGTVPCCCSCRRRALEHHPGWRSPPVVLFRCLVLRQANRFGSSVAAAGTVTNGCTSTAASQRPRLDDRTSGCHLDGRT
jgi:hypothetical protein